MIPQKKAYSFSHKHGSVENDCIWKAIIIGDISIFTESWLLEEEQACFSPFDHEWRFDVKLLDEFPYLWLAVGKA